MYVHCFQNPTSTKETSFGAYSDAPFPNHNRNAPTVSFYKNKEHVSFIQFIYYCINNIKPRWFFLLRFFQKLVFHLSLLKTAIVKKLLNNDQCTHFTK